MKTYLKGPWGLFLVGTFLAVVAWAVFGIWGYYKIRCGLAPEKWGQFGDGFGVLNSLFTALAFVAVAVAFYREREAAKDRESEHQDVLRKMNANNKAMVHLARITALSALISHYRDEAEHIRVNGVSVASGSGKVAADRKETLGMMILTYEAQLAKLVEISEIM